MVTDTCQLLTVPAVWSSLDLNTLTLEDLERGSAASGDFQLDVIQCGQLDALCLWFEVLFPCSDTRLSTSPFAEATHWQQTLVWLPRPVQVTIDHKLTGSLALRSNQVKRRDLDIEISCLRIEDKSASSPSCNGDVRDAADVAVCGGQTVLDHLLLTMDSAV